MFRRQKVTKKLSADELKSKLYAHFDKSGSLNHLRTQIRSQLASELFKMSSSTTAVSKHNNENVGLGNTLLPLQVCNWLVYDHLMRQGYQYTLSTFVSETNLPYPEKLLAVGDILALLGLDNSSSEYKKIGDLYSTSNENEGLHSLLLAIIKSVIFVSDKDDQQIENVLNSSPEAEIKNKLLSSNEKNVSETVQKEAFGKESSKREELNEAASLESSYYEQLQSMKKEKEKEIQNLRHKLIQELERLHSQEQLLYQEIEQEKKEIRKERDLLFSEREKLKDKESLFLKEQENKLEKKIREIEETYVAKLHSKKKEIEELQDELKEKEKKLVHMEFELSTHRERFDTLKRELDDINRMYKSVHEKYNSLLDENTNLVRKFESMSDYNILKDELVAKGREISNLQREIENLHRTAERDKKAYTETVASLELKLKATEPKLRNMQEELNQTRDTLHMEKSLWHKEKKRLEEDSVTSKELYRTVLQRIEEQKQDIHDLHQTIHILHYQLTTGNTNRTTKSEPYDHVRTVSKSTSILKSNKNNPISLSQQYQEKALSFTSDSKSRLNKLQQKVDEGFDKYSLMYRTSFDTKMPHMKHSLPHSSPTFARNMRFNQPSFTKNSANTSSSFHLDTSKSFMTLGHLNLKNGSAAIPNFMNRNNSSHLSDTVTSAQNIYRGTKAFMTDSAIASVVEPNNIYADTFPSQTEQPLKPSEIFEQNSYTNKILDRYQVPEHIETLSFLSSRNNQNRFDTNKTKEGFSSGLVESVSTGLTGNTFKGIHVTETVTTENTTNSPNATDVSLQKSFVFPTTSNKVSSQNTDHNSIEQSLVSSNANFKDTTVSLISSSPTNQAASTDSLKQHETAPIVTVHQVSAGLENQAAFYDSLKQHEATPIIAVSQTSSGVTNQAGSSDSLQQREVAPIIVDLDAAWKRKTSVPSLDPPLLQKSNPFMFAKNVIPDSEGETKQSGSISNRPDAMLSKNELLTAEKSHTGASPNSKTIENTDHISLAIQQNQNSLKNSEQQESVNEDQVRFSLQEAESTIKNSEQQKDLVKLPQTEAASTLKNSEQQGELNVETETIKEFASKSNSNKPTETQINNKSVVLSDVSGTDEDVQDKSKSFEASQSAIKQNPEESLSELSEVHMSCGSEQEEQREESDNW